MIISNVAPSLNQPQRVFPLAHSWDSPWTESYEYKTDLIRSAEGKEQRRAVRAYPRRTFEYALTFMRQQKYLLDQFFDQSPAKLAWMPEENKVTHARTQMGGQDFTMPVRNSEQDWMRPGVTVLLQYRGQAETRVIASAGSNVLTFTEKNDTVWPVGTKVTKAALCRITPGPESTRLTDNAGTMKVSALVDPGSDPYEPDTAGQQFLGFREYFGGKFNWDESPVITHAYPQTDIDYGFGRIATYVSEKFPQRITKLNYWRGSAGTVKQLIDMFCRQYGMNREFYFEGIEKQIPFATMAGQTQAILLDGLHFADVYADSTVYRRVLIKLKDGTEIHRQVDFIQALPDTNSSIIWLTEALPDVPLSQADVRGVFWVTVARFATDRLDVSWLTSEVAKLALPFQNLENLDL